MFRTLLGAWLQMDSMRRGLLYERSQHVCSGKTFWRFFLNLYFRALRFGAIHIQKICARPLVFQSYIDECNFSLVWLARYKPSFERICKLFFIQSDSHCADNFEHKIYSRRKNYKLIYMQGLMSLPKGASSYFHLSRPHSTENPVYVFPEMKLCST